MKDNKNKFNKGDLVLIDAPRHRKETRHAIIINPTRTSSMWQVVTINGNKTWYEECHIKLVAGA